MKEVETYKSKNKDITALIKMIEKCRIELLELYQQLMKKDKELENYMGKRNTNSNRVIGNNGNT